jgi:hypothetical protein
VTVDPTLAARVASLLADYLDDDNADGGGDAPDPLHAPVAIRSGTAQVLVRLVDADPPLVRVFSPLLRDVPSSSDLLAELNEINSHLAFLRVFWRDNTVFAATELLASSLDATNLTHACDTIADLSDYYDNRLSHRFGGHTAYS